MTRFRVIINVQKIRWLSYHKGSLGYIFQTMALGMYEVLGICIQNMPLETYKALAIGFQTMSLETYEVLGEGLRLHCLERKKPWV